MLSSVEFLKLIAAKTLIKNRYEERKEWSMASKNDKLPWEGRICNGAQVGGIETSIVDDGPGRGVRIAWVNTGTGLRYKVAIDRAMDIVDAFFNEHSLAWLSHLGINAPRPDANHELEWLYGFGGGLVTTCGLTHIGAPETDEGGHRGLHGRVSSMRASLQSINQPDPARGEKEMSISGLIKQSKVFGPSLEMQRTISSRIGRAGLHIRDVVTNRGNTPSPLMLLYHCNFGWPLVDEGADIVWKGKWTSFGRKMDDEIFNDRHNFKKCQKPLKSHTSEGESCCYIDVNADKKGRCKIGIANQKLGLALQMSYKKSQLPYVTNWQHWGFGDYVVALEPGTNPPRGQIEARQKRELTMLGPGKSKTFELDIDVLSDKSEIKGFLKAAGK